MITQKNNIPLDNSLNEETEDQQSQQHIHNNGFDGSNTEPEEKEQADPEILKQAFDASEPSVYFRCREGNSAEERLTVNSFQFSVFRWSFIV